MANGSERLASIIQSVSYSWIDFSAPNSDKDRFLTFDRDLERRTWPLFDALLNMRFGRPIRVQHTDFTLGALRHMYFRAELLRRSKRADIDEYETSDLELYVADFIVQAYAAVKQPRRSFDLALFGDILITEDVVDTTADDLPEDWPTDWWRRNRLRR